jgi:selenocysteine-specific elongation factor
MKSVIVGTAGHIDHGKTALVKALTGIDADRLEEEKRRGITIDIGFAHLELAGPDGDKLRLGFVDVPGHERFVRNMLAGAGGIDIVLLVVACDESIKPQTREHFDICRLLGVERGVIALTKCDLASPDARELVRLEVSDFVRGSFLENAPIVPVSARTGEGLDALKQELLRAAIAAPGKDSARWFRLPIDRSFAMKGFGTVVTGTLVSGEVKPEDEVEVFPAKRLLRVRGVHSGGQAVERAVAGQRTAVNLAGVEVGELARGMALAAPNRFETTQRFDARVTLLGSARLLKNRARVHFHQGTSETIAEVVLLEGKELRPGHSALAQLRLDAPVLVLPGDRFILRQFSPVVTIGGGVVLENLAPRHKQRDSGVIGYLTTLERGTRAEILAAMAARAPDSLDVARIIGRTGWLESEILEAAAQLNAAGKLRVLTQQPLAIAAAETVARVAAQAFSAMEVFHRANPLMEGMSKEDLRVRAAPKASAELFRAALDDLAAAGKLTVAGDLARRAGREIALQPEEARAKEQIAGEFARAGLTVPSVKEVLARLSVEARRAQKILQILLREKVLVKVSGDLVFHREAIDRLRQLLADYKKQKGERLAIAAFKEMTGISRKYAIPLLEYLDRENVTRRVGDERVIL